MSKSNRPPNPEIASKAPERLSKGLRDNSGPVVLEHDIASAEANLEAQNVEMAGNAVVLSPNDIVIERIPFSTEEHIRGHLA